MNFNDRLHRLEQMFSEHPAPCQCTGIRRLAFDKNGDPVCERCAGSIAPGKVELPTGFEPPAAPIHDGGNL